MKEDMQQSVRFLKQLKKVGVKHFEGCQLKVSFQEEPVPVESYEEAMNKQSMSLMSRTVPDYVNHIEKAEQEFLNRGQ